MKTMLALMSFTFCIGAFASTVFEIVGQDTGTVQFDYENGGNQFTIVGAGGQTFKTCWSGCGSNKIYACRDRVALVSTEMSWNSFPDDVSSFSTLDWEQRAPTIREGRYVVFMNDARQFLVCKVIDVKAKSRSDDEDLLTFEFKVFDSDADIASEIVRIHEEKKSDYISKNKNEGVVRFDFENNCGSFVVIGTNDQRFTTCWSRCNADAIGAYRDRVKLVCDEVRWDDFPTNADVFVSLDWEQRAVTIREGGFVVFMNNVGQFLCCKVIEVKDSSCGEADDLVEFEFKIYDADAEISEEIVRLQEERKSGYVIEGKNEGTAQFDFENNSGRFVIIGENGQKFRTCWSTCGSKSIYAYRDEVKNVGLLEGATAFPSSATAFIRVERGQRVVTVHEGEYVVFMNNLGQFLCCHVVGIKTQSAVDDALLTFDYKIYDADALVLDAIVAMDNARGESRLNDDFIITADISSDRAVTIPFDFSEDLVKIRIVRIIKSGGLNTKCDITDFLEIPKAKDGVIDLSKIQVKAMYASEVFDIERGAKLIFGRDRMHIETANTREGLVYDFYEASDLKSLMNTVKESKIGDGTPFIPSISNGDSKCRFFTIKVRAL